MNYDAFARTAAILLTSAGRSVVFTRKDSLGFDPALGVDVNEAVIYTGKAVKLNYKQSEVDGVNVIAGDARLVTEALSIVPKAGDKVSVDGATFRIMSVETVDPDGTPIIHKLHIRR